LVGGGSRTLELRVSRAPRIPPAMADEALMGEHALLVSRRSDYFAG